MIEADLRYLQKFKDCNVIRGPVLELGTGYGGDTCRACIEKSALQYFATDMQPGPNVDFVADFERAGDMNIFRGFAPFWAVLVLNVLEHTFDPIRILDNAMSLWTLGEFCRTSTKNMPNVAA